MSDNRKKLKDAEDDLLKKLAEASGSLLDNDELIATLEETKTKYPKTPKPQNPKTPVGRLRGWRRRSLVGH